MAGRMVAAVLLAGLAGAGAIASVRAGERHGYWGGPGWGMHGGWHGRWSMLSPEDRAAFTDARIAALHAGMKLNPDQEKLWPPVEMAIRDLVKLREARREAMRDPGRMQEEDAPAKLRSMADAATARGEALRKLADATAPLYTTLDEGQKRRARMLARPMSPGFGHGGWRHRMQDDGPQNQQ